MTSPGPISPEVLEEITTRGVSEIISREEFVRLLQSGRKLRLKMGFDPSRPDIHLGHVVGLRKLRRLQELGHQVILIVGDWTAQIGDPSGQSATRPMLTHAQVMENAESYIRQFFKVVDQTRTEVRYQSEWFGEFGLAKVIELTGRFTVAQFLQRADFAQRFADQKPIAITELLYPLLQAYDSVEIRADVEFGGTDQKFNLLVGRELQGMMGQTPQQCFMMPILVGTDGVKKMSKSLNNYVAVDEAPIDMYGKLMQIPDNLIYSYFELLTDKPLSEIEQLRAAVDYDHFNPMLLKKRLAFDITAQFHDNDAACMAELHFENVHQARDLPEIIPEFNIEPYYAETTETPSQVFRRFLVDAGLVRSNSEARRLLEQGAIEKLSPDGSWSKLTYGTPILAIQTGNVIKRGKRRFIRITSSYQRA